MKKNYLIKSTFIVMLVALISKVIGLFRDMLIASKFGATPETNAHALALTIPDTIFVIIGLAISTTFLPMLSKVRAENGREEMNKFANNVINILIIISAFIFIISMCFPDKIVNLISDSNEETTHLAVELTRILLINIVFLSVNACFTAILQVNEDFIVPSLLGLFFNLPMILYMIFIKDYNIYGLAVTNVIGNILRILVQLPSLYKHGYRYKFLIDFKDKRLKKVIILIIPVMVASGANSINMMVDKRIASTFDAPFVLNNAQLLITVVTTLITTSVTNVVYPVLANRINEGKSKEFISILSKSVIYLSLLLIPITVGLLYYGFDVVKLIYCRGNYTSQNAYQTSIILFGYSFGLFFTGIRDLLNSTLFSMGCTKITAKNGCIGVAINIIFSIVLSKYFGVIGISIASSIAMAVTAVLLLINIVKLQGSIDIKNLLTKLFKIVFATIIMALFIYVIKNFTVNLNYIMAMMLGVIVAFIIYFVVIKLVKVNEFDEIISYVLKRRK